MFERREQSFEISVEGYEEDDDDERGGSILGLCYLVVSYLHDEKI